MHSRCSTFVDTLDSRCVGEAVMPMLPAVLVSSPAAYPPNRWGLAEWLVDPSNPLLARVTVNRFWQMYFSTGIVKTTENFGSQGEAPSHPDLLDWLATEFVRTGWDVKALQKTIVMSATYRQASRLSPELLAKDPEMPTRSRPRPWPSECHSLSLLIHLG